MSVFSMGCPGILGIGIDLVDSRRIEKILSQHPQAFPKRLFTEQERCYAHDQKNPALFYAKRFAAKEAFAKATGWGMGAMIGWKDIEIVSGKMGQPWIALSGSCYEKLRRTLGRPFRALVSLTDEKPYAQACVLLTFREADPTKPAVASCTHNDVQGLNGAVCSAGYILVV